MATLVWKDGDQSDITITNCYFEKCKSADFGGVIVVTSNSFVGTDLYITLCTFLDITSGGAGGCMFVEKGGIGLVSDTTFTNCVTEASSSNGGLAYMTGVSYTWTNCTMKSCMCTENGGILCCFNTTLIISNCVMCDSRCDNIGGAVILIGGSTGKILTSTFTRNRGLAASTFCTDASNAQLTVSSCEISNSVSDSDGGVALSYGIMIFIDSYSM